MMKSDEQRPSWLRDAEPSAGVEGCVFYGGRTGISYSHKKKTF